MNIPIYFKPLDVAILTVRTGWGPNANIADAVLESRRWPPKTWLREKLGLR